MSRKILVTGGAGFIGNHNVDRLVDVGPYIKIGAVYRITLFDR